MAGFFSVYEQCFFVYEQCFCVYLPLVSGRLVLIFTTFCEFWTIFSVLTFEHKPQAGRRFCLVTEIASKGGVHLVISYGIFYGFITYQYCLPSFLCAISLFAAKRPVNWSGATIERAKRANHQILMLLETFHLQRKSTDH